MDRKNNIRTVVLWDRVAIAAVSALLLVAFGICWVLGIKIEDPAVTERYESARAGCIAAYGDDAARCLAEVDARFGR